MHLCMLVTLNVDPSSCILSSLKMEAIGSSEKSALTRVTRRHIPGDGLFFINNPAYLPEYALPRRNVEWKVGSCKKEHIESTWSKGRA
jgi:hypothetical protein